MASERCGWLCGAEAAHKSASIAGETIATKSSIDASILTPVPERAASSTQGRLEPMQNGHASVERRRSR
ncbi:hypothetical protein [Lysobacter gummosus]|uniref:hypothetical protein n=1 Tax=Lysobacter gummosus TaxID=262324 RepID=UPI00363837D4